MVSTLASLIRGSRVLPFVGWVVIGCAASSEQAGLQRRDAGVSGGAETDNTADAGDASAGDRGVDASSFSTNTEANVDEPSFHSMSSFESASVTTSEPSASSSSSATGATFEPADSGVSWDTSDRVSSSDTSADETPSGPPPLLNCLPWDVERIIAGRCRLCHSRLTDGQQPLLDTWAQVSSKAELVLNAVSRDIMPLLPPPLTPDQKQVLTDWIDQGAPPVTQDPAPNCSG